MEQVELNIVALADSESSPGNYVLILEEYKGVRRLPVVIGVQEAQAIAVSLENMQPNRPLTHDLMKNILLQLQATLKSVCIHAFENNIFHARLNLKTSTGNVEVDSRTSDAIALAVRFECPIYATKAVLDEASVIFQMDSQAFMNKRGEFADYSVQELEQLLQQVLAKEDYESASKIRDALRDKS